jgi:hypothetical protein
MSVIIAFQPALRPALPTVYGPLDYREQRELIVRIDRILSESKLDDAFLQAAIRDQGIDPGKRSAKQNERFARYSALCLRANVARMLLGLAHREFCARLADSALLQWLLQVGEVDAVKAFAKSTSQRFDAWVAPASMQAINDRLIALCAVPVLPGQAAPFGLQNPVRCDEAFFDTTVVKAPIHFPTDWVLLRDAVRTLMKGTLCIRRAGLKQRMPLSPEDLMREMNVLCMAMSAQRRQKDSKKQRKRILRSMKKLGKRVGEHAQAHLQALQTRREETELSSGQARVIEQRLSKVIEQLPAAMKQAHERIIGGRPVNNADKILSLYDRQVEVIVRGKANAEVEFGNKLTLVESWQGMILDYQLHEGNPADSNLVKPCVERMQAKQLELKKIWSDRGMSSRKNEEYLQAQGISSGLCPRDPRELARRLQDPEVKVGMKRRGGTEARIAIFKNVFLGNPAAGRSMAARERACGWAVLTHNLWVLARLPRAGTVESKQGDARKRPKREADATEFRAVA